MLPFLKKRYATEGMVVTQRTPDDSKEPSNDSVLEITAKEALDAINANDYKKFAASLKAFFEICDSYPHAEGEHTNEDET